MPRPPSEPRASRPIAERIALSLIVGLSADSQVVLIKFRFIRGGTETIHLPKAVAATLQAVTKLRGTVKLVAPASLPNDGKVIADERPLG